VTKIVNFGAFVRVRDGLEGLIHISELSHQRVAHPGDVVHEGQRLNLKIISLDSERHRLGLSLKQAEEPPARPSEAPRERDRERRPRQERAYAPSQAVQAPEGGIDNTLAAAFAQVRLQMEEAESADAPPAGAAAAETAATDEGSEAMSAMESQASEAPGDAAIAEVLNEAGGDGEAPVSEAADAPALEVAPAEPLAGAEAPDTAEAAPDTAEAPQTTEVPEPELTAEVTEPHAKEVPAPIPGEGGEAATSEVAPSDEAAAMASETAPSDESPEQAAETTSPGEASSTSDESTSPAVSPAFEETASTER
ncbi:MAG: S1 RNA-binding domain-containing protein, partial [Candidatus Limnocylindria bacterium]